MSPEIITETPDYFVINKPPGMACEPPSHEATLRDWLIENGHINKSDWKEEERYGIVHRLDTDTSGVTIWAKNKDAQERLKLEWQGRQVEKIYIALVVGECNKEGEIELSIARDNKNDKMKVVWLNDQKSRPSITRYKLLAVGHVNSKKAEPKAKPSTESYKLSGAVVSLVEAHPVTGRTHQIRIHFKAISHPLIGDKLYGEKATDEIAKNIGLNRQFLHASNIKLEDKEYTAPLPEDLKSALAKTGIAI